MKKYPYGFVIFLICLLFGCFGAHRFMTGKIGSAVLFLLTGGIFGIGWFVDVIRVLMGKFTDADGNKISLWE